MVAVPEFVQKVLELIAIEADVSVDDENKMVDLEVETISEGLTCPHSLPPAKMHVSSLRRRVRASPMGPKAIQPFYK
jgi:hypothetical protein